MNEVMTKRIGKIALHCGKEIDSRPMPAQEIEAQVIKACFADAV
jgi:hypothetical protein